ncbi:UNVERIFIED_CONTAM: hypothetical protein GTU68_049949 [Idotea baltica]|nr:hypothetical protein [Idotea baltica]
MGILNATPDSFYNESRVTIQNSLEKKVAMMIEEGVDILDVGGYSTRPGAANVKIEEEINRVVPIIEFIKTQWPEILISIDTFRGAVAKEAVRAGASIINDVSGGTLDKEMFGTVAQLGVPYILMHMRGTPETMNNFCSYKNVTIDVIKELQSKVLELNDLGVKDIIIDPGFGFAKTLEQNYQLLEDLEMFKVLELPILIGISRKSMISKYLEIPSESSLNGTSVLNTKALKNGVNILRVHDVKEAVEVRKLLSIL